MSEGYIYCKCIQYMRKGKWRSCQLQIGLLKRCQDILMAILEEINDKLWKHTFVIYGYECNNDFVSLIGANEIHLIKFETFELAPEMTEVLENYIKDVSYKIQLQSCTSPHCPLVLNEWYMLHVQINGICITTDNGSRLVTKWNRSNIGRCQMEDCTLNIEVIFKREKGYYSFYRDERYLIEKIFKAIQNLKFEFPSSRPDKLLLAPRRSGSVDLRGVVSWGNVKERIARGRTCSSSRAEDYMSLDDSSPPSTPSSPLCSFGTSIPESTISTKCYSHIDEKDEELIFELDSSDSGVGVTSSIAKSSEYSTINGNQSSCNEHNHKRLVDLERFPFESDLRSQGKLSPDLNSHNSSLQQMSYIQNPNVYEGSKNGECYQTLDFIKHHRKASSEANFVQHKKNNYPKMNVSHSVDVQRCNRDAFTISSSDKLSNSSSPMLMLSSSNISSDTHDSSKSKDPEEACLSSQDSKVNRSSPTSFVFSEPNHEYYNMKTTIESNDPISHQYPVSFNHDDKYFNLKPSSTKNYQGLYLQIPLSQDFVVTARDISINYVELDFRDNTNDIISKKTVPYNNYTEINHLQTEILKEMDDNIKHKSHKKKKQNFFKLIMKK